MKPQINKLLYNLGNNLITLGNLKCPKGMKLLDTHENWFVAEVMNEITHLPYDSFLIPFLSKFQIDIKSLTPNDILSIENWGLGYLDPIENLNHLKHSECHSVQSDATVVTKNTVVLFEFKKPHKTPSQNAFDIKQVGRQVILATKLCTDYNTAHWKSIIVCNTAPNLHVKNVGLLSPHEAANKYFKEENEWSNDPIIKKLLSKVNLTADNYCVLNWPDFINKGIETLKEAIFNCSSIGLKRLHENAMESLLFFLERRKDYL